MDKIDKEDARFQTLEQLHERRKQVVRLHRKGYGVMSIVAWSNLETRGIATSSYACILFIGASLGAFLPTMMNSNGFIFLISFSLFLCALQLIVLKRKY